MTRIMIFGTFDMIHKGHEDMFKQARSLAEDPFLIVSIARDSVVSHIKGALPVHTEEERRQALEEHPYIDKAILGDREGYITHIVHESPDYIALGYDQEGAYVETLREDLAAAGLEPEIVRLKAFQPDVYKTSKLRS